MMMLMLLLAQHSVVVAAERLSKASSGRSEFRLNPSLLFLVLPLIMGSLIAWLRSALHCSVGACFH